MKKEVLTFVALLMAVLPAFSESVSVQTAQRAAQSFLNSKKEGNPEIQLIDFDEKASFPNFYVFGNEHCFVIIAADDCVQPVLGYSTEGGFGNEPMPDCVSDWLKAYTDGIAAVKESRLDATAEIRSEWEMLLNGRGLEPKSRTHVEPLVQTHWDQGAPYNVLCPVEPTHPSGHTPAGCGATAMAQIMKYWERPIRGVGSKTYTPRDHPQYGELTVDFSNTVYDWDNMPTSINQNSPQEQIDAVATLIYHCGVSVKMDYGWPSGSSVHWPILDDAFRDHFNYASNHDYMYTDYLYKSDTTDEGWILMLKNELDNSRPMLYRGATESGGGHLFVCDGYDENNYFHFNWGWSGSHDGYYAIGALHPTVNYSYANAAVFYCAPNYSITASVIPSAAGEVVGEGNYPLGSSVTLNAVGSPGFTFSHWDDGSVQNPRTIQVIDDLEFIAYFTQIQYTITASASPSNGGTVTGGGTYTYNQTCTVTAAANTGYAFVNWTENGNVVSDNASYTFSVTGNRDLVAHFQLDNFVISVSAEPSNGGSVTGGGAFHYGDNCTVIATSNTGFNFVNWTENGNVVSTDANYTFTVASNRNLVAHFQLQSYTITVSADPSNGGSVTGDGTYNYGQSCTVTATANTGYTFINWTENGNVVSTNASYTFTVTSNRNLVAHFQLDNYVVSVSADPANGGSVTGGGAFHYGDNCTVIATANPGFNFVNWTKNGTQVSTDPSYSFTVTESANYVAHFTAQSYTINVSANPSDGGSVSGGGTFTYGQTCTVQATANACYSFVNWTENGNVVSTQADYNLTVTGNHNLVANFIRETYEITTEINPEGAGIVTGTGTYQCGETCTLNAIPNENYIFLNWTENGNVIPNDSTMQFTVTGHRHFVANFICYDGVEESAKPIQVYPNPVNDILTIKGEGVRRVTVYNVMGQIVEDRELEGQEEIRIDVNGYESASYILRIYTENGLFVEHFVKE